LKKLFVNRKMLTGSMMVAAIVLCILFAGLFAPNDPLKIAMNDRFAAPSSTFPLGADAYGRCILSRLLYGSRYSLGLAVCIMGIVIALVLPMGMTATYRGGITERIFLLSCDVSMALPPTVFVLTIMGVMGNGIGNLVFSAVFSYWGWYGRMVRSYTASEINKGYVVSAIVGGSSALKILSRHVFPNILPGLLVLFALGIGDTILLISGFSFLGIGLPSGSPEWGAMMSDAKSVLLQAPQYVIYPGLCVFFTVCGFNLLGEGLRGILSPYGKGVDYE